MAPADANIFISKASEIIGVPLEVWEYEKHGRGGIRFRFPSWPEATSPIFSIRRSGMFGAVVSLEFGRLAGNCILKINRQSNQEKKAFARTILTELNSKYKKDDGLDCKFLESLEFSGDTLLSFVFRDREAKEPMVKAMGEVLKPLVASIACLMEDASEDDDIEGDVEGASVTITLTKKERSPRNRMLAIMIHGEICGVCNIEPRKEFGDGLGNIIEVHHIEPLAESGEGKVYNPQTDLVPLCPNCHRMIHSRNPAYTPYELKELLQNE